MNFGEALVLIKAGVKVGRSGWNGKGMFLFQVDSWSCHHVVAKDRQVLPFIAMKTSDDRIVPWLASQTDIQAADWVQM
jgi:hypothetical protein